jgi:FkbM family methyltransferase
MTRAADKALRIVHAGLHRFGVDLVRWPKAEPLYRTASLVQAHRVDCTLDVGANNGGFGTALRRFGYTGDILSFEPVGAAYDALTAATATDPRWTALKLAVGDRETTVSINVAGNAAASSSVLPMLDRHLAAAPESAYVRAEEVPQKRLDDLPEVRALVDSGATLFLKIDVQGYERSVLDGAKDLLASGRVVALQMELSFVPLYEGAMTWQEGVERATEAGMVLMGLHPAFTDPDTGQLLQADALFMTPPASA